MFGPGSQFCRCPEHVLLAAHGRCQWPDPLISWTIVGELPHISFAELKAACEWGFAQWARVSGVQSLYRELSYNARVLIGSRRIDGGEGILAETELPCGLSQVRMWFDTSEDWAVGFRPQQRQVILADVAWHEIGHALGLEHAPDGSANCMAPIYDPSITTPGPWDLAEIQRRYPLPAPTAPPAVIPIPKPSAPGVPRMTREDLRAQLERVLAVAQFVARMTPNALDDKIVALLQQATASDWVLDLVLSLLSRGQPLSLDALAQAVASVKLAAA